MNQVIKISVGQHRLRTTNPALARQVLEQSTGLTDSATFAGELACISSINPPAIGSYWHGEGGIFAGTVRGENGQPDYHLVVPNDPSGQVESIKWGADGEDEPGAQSLRDGLANTRVLFESEHDHPAANWATDLTIDGHRDFYLPARHELRLCYLNVPELFSTKDWYWSSTQYSPNHAWIQGFGGGNQGDDLKDYARRAVAVRRVSAL